MTTVKFGMRVQAWDFLPRAKFCKNCLRDISFLGKVSYFIVYMLAVDIRYACTGQTRL